MAKKQSVYALYLKQLKVVKKRIAKLESEGFIIPNIKEVEHQLKKPTKRSLEKLKKLTEKEIVSRKGALYQSEITGEKISGKLGLKERLSLAQKNRKRIPEYVDYETGEIYTNNIDYSYSSFDYGQALYDGLENIIDKYIDSDNRWIRYKANYLKSELLSADKTTLIDNLSNMSSEVIEYIQSVLEESGGGKEEINNNQAKLVEIAMLIRGDTLSMTELRSFFNE